MASKAPQQGSYKEYEATLRSLLAPEQPLASKVVVVHGTSEVLLAQAIDLLRAKALALGLVATSLEAATLTDNALLALASQASLFEPATFYILRRAEGAKQLAKLLGGIKQPQRLSNHLCFVHQGDAPPAPLLKELNRLQAAWVPCMVPRAEDLPLVIKALAGRLGLKLAPDAVRLLFEAHGDDLVKQANELRKLSLILTPQQRQTELAAVFLAPHLGMLREDEAAQLELLLAAGQWAKAQALTGSLLLRGEKILALLAILSRYCRNMLRIGEATARGLPAAAVASTTRLPQSLVKTYLPHLRRPFDPAPYLRALNLCQLADMSLKSRPIGDDLLLTRIIDALAHPAYTD